MTDIKPCPFCNGTEFFVQTGTTDREGIPSHIVCDCCGAGGPWSYLTEEELDIDELPAKLIQRWNQRK